MALKSKHNPVNVDAETYEPAKAYSEKTGVRGCGSNEGLVGKYRSGTPEGFRQGLGAPQDSTSRAAHAARLAFWYTPARISV